MTNSILRFLPVWLLVLGSGMYSWGQIPGVGVKIQDFVADMEIGLESEVYGAQIVAERFDGMAVPGVRGNGSQGYSNIVIFRPSGRWRTWLCRKKDPYELEQTPHTPQQADALHSPPDRR